MKEEQLKATRAVYDGKSVFMWLPWVLAARVALYWCPCYWLG